MIWPLEPLKEGGRSVCSDVQIKRPFIVYYGVETGCPKAVNTRRFFKKKKKLYSHASWHSMYWKNIHQRVNSVYFGRLGLKMVIQCRHEEE